MMGVAAPSCFDAFGLKLQYRGLISIRRVSEEDRAVIQGALTTTSELHELWASLENECHRLAILIEEAPGGGADVRLLRDRQARLLLHINAVVAQIREAPATTLHDHLALLDVAIEHEIDLAADIAFYGARDFPMITRLLRALARTVPGFEFNSLRRSLSSPGQFEQLMDDAIEAGGPIGFGRR
jgi:hypothetical protein